MFRFFFFSLFFLIAGGIVPAQSQEAHLKEAGAGEIYSRSAFAHGYRHGYEEGYHMGNLDINMARIARTQKSQFKGLASGYSPEFGSKELFESGFHAGVVVGYSDGYSGRMFRAIDAIRTVALSLEPAPLAADEKRSSFDPGFAAGYGDGLRRKEPEGISTTFLDFHSVGCGRNSSEKADDAREAGSYCEGYRRGFVVGAADALATSERIALEAAK